MTPCRCDKEGMSRRYGYHGGAELRRYEEAKAARRPHVEQQTLGGDAA